MEFGRMPITEIDQVDFTLPPEPLHNGKVLPGKPADGKVYVGMPRWGRTEWVGKIYPERTKEKDFLSHYVNHFNSVELNATHYKLYGAKGIGKWAEMARDHDFRFCPKMYKGITHKFPLTGKEFIISEFMNGISAFGEHLGPIFLQLHEKFQRENELINLLESLPSKFQYMVEVRHPNLVTSSSLTDWLRSHEIGLVITDTAGRRDCAHMNLTVPKTMIRFIANGHASDAGRITEWSNRIKVWLDKGIKEVYFFVHVEDEEKGLDVAKFVIGQFNEVCKTNLLPLTFLQ